VVFAAVASDAFLTQRNIVNISCQIVTNGFPASACSCGSAPAASTFGRLMLALAGLLATGLQEQMHRRRSPSHWLREQR
jgi:hypothetical protein